MYSPWSRPCQNHFALSAPRRQPGSRTSDVACDTAFQRPCSPATRGSQRAISASKRCSARRSASTLPGASPDHASCFLQSGAPPTGAQRAVATAMTESGLLRRPADALGAVPPRCRRCGCVRARSPRRPGDGDPRGGRGVRADPGGGVRRRGGSGAGAGGAGAGGALSRAGAGEGLGAERAGAGGGGAATRPGVQAVRNHRSVLPGVARGARPAPEGAAGPGQRRAGAGLHRAAPQGRPGEESTARG